METTLSDVLPNTRWVANGTQTEFTFSFQPLKSEYMKVYSNGELVESGYTLGNGVVTFATAPTSGTVINIMRQIPLSYQEKYENLGILTLESLNHKLVEVTAQLQGLAEKLQRAATAPINSDIVGEELMQSIIDSAATIDTTLEQAETIAEGVTQAGIDAAANVEKAEQEAVARINQIGSSNSEISKAWAVGNDDEIDEIAPGQNLHSSKVNANIAMTIANEEPDVPLDESTLGAEEFIRGPKGDNGVSFIPHLDSGVLSWTNDGNLENPDDFDFNVAYNSVVAEGTKQKNLIESTGTNQVSLVTAEGTKQIGLVEDEGDTQIARVTGLVDQAAESATAAANSATAAASSAEAAADSALSVDAENIVHKEGEETITGKKKFTQSINKISNEMDITVIPETNLYSALDFRDKNGLRMGAVESEQVGESNNFVTRIQSNREVNGAQKYSQIQAVIAPDGSMWGSAPTTPAGAVNNEIAVASWVLSRINNIMSNGMVTGGDNYIEIPVKNRSTTLKIQWGSASGGATVAFPKAFSSIPIVLVAQSDGGDNQTNVGSSTITTSNFKNIRYGTKWIAIGY